MERRVQRQTKLAPGLGCGESVSQQAFERLADAVDVGGGELVVEREGDGSGGDGGR